MFKNTIAFTQKPAMNRIKKNIAEKSVQTRIFKICGSVTVLNVHLKRFLFFIFLKRRHDILKKFS